MISDINLASDCRIIPACLSSASYRRGASIAVLQSYALKFWCLWDRLIDFMIAACLVLLVPCMSSNILYAGIAVLVTNIEHFVIILQIKVLTFCFVWDINDNRFLHELQLSF